MPLAHFHALLALCGRWICFRGDVLDCTCQEALSHLTHLLRPCLIFPIPTMIDGLEVGAAFVAVGNFEVCYSKLFVSYQILTCIMMKTLFGFRQPPSQILGFIVDKL